MILWLRNLSIVRKLYAVMALVALMFVLEIVVLRYAVIMLSAMRSFTEIEANWSKSQKNAVLHLYQYASTQDGVYYDRFQENLRVPLGFKQGRLAMMDCPDLSTCDEAYQRAFEGFGQGGVPKEDLHGFIRLIRHLRSFAQFKGASSFWIEMDQLLDQLIMIGDELYAEISNGELDQKRMRSTLTRLADLNEEFTDLQARFAGRLSDGTQFVESALIFILLLAVATVATVASYVIYRLMNYFGVTINEVKEVASRVGRGDFGMRVPVRSADELGQMAQGLNRMIEDLQASLGEKEEAESANQLKSLFLANMSHEVRTPLGVILGLIEILKTPGLSEGERQNYLIVIERTGQNLKQIINDILDISKVEAGHLEIQKARVKLNDFIDELSINMDLLAQRGRNFLVMNPVGAIPELIITDRARLSQMLTNLIGNGLKFTHEGQVTISFGVDQGMLYFRVADTGIGISKAGQEKLFKPFSQVDHASTRKYGGTGLGLLLSKRLAQAMGGDIVLESSVPGEGSVFLLTVPLEIAQAETQKPGEQNAVLVKRSSPVGDDPAFPGAKVLLVEDSVDNQMLVKLFLTKKGALVETADNGKEGVEKALQGNFDLVLMDMQMPVIDGYTATQKLRQMGYRKPIIALTAHAMKEDREHCLRVGCNDYLTKPIDPPLFYETLAKQLSERTDAPPG